DVAKFANYTSFSRGINGLMIDIANLPADVVPEASDFRFHTGNDSTPGDWPELTLSPVVTFHPGAGTADSDRVTLTFPDGAIRNTWLEVTVEPTAHCPLPTADIFYFGNAVAEAGNSTADAQVTTADLLLARNNPRDFLSPTPLTFAYDYDRDGYVNATDVLLARNNQTNFLSALPLLDLRSVAAESAPWSLAELAWLAEFTQSATDQPTAEQQASDAVLAGWEL
ncbi:MAG: hypothetical protein HQ567_17785, partial [Candidatus Nealsonbacteria bacterium]|nr:hypothetical protein [Candidatus Nealsonbacteria bacterium]